jgi:hypothetical protein
MHQRHPGQTISVLVNFIAIAWLAVLGSIAASSDAAEFVIHVSIDGLNASYLQTMIDSADGVPSFTRLQAEGAWTANARTDHTYTITLPNHTTMLTGRPVTQPTGMANTWHHGWTSNSDPASTSVTLHNSGNLNVPYKASTFDVVHDAGLSTAHFASKTKFSLFGQSYDAGDGAPHPNGSNKIDYFYADSDIPEMQSLLLDELGSQHFNYTFLHYANADNAGHSSGWGGTTWKNAVRTVDGYLGELFDLIENDPVLDGHTAIVLSADHGGSGTGHSTATNAANYTIPFMAWGAGVAHGDLYALNATSRTDPGTSRVEYIAAGQPIRNGDGGNLALSLLGLNAIPGSLINAAQDLRVAMPGDFNGDGSVDGGDLAVWEGDYGATSLSSHADGDVDGDRDVDGADFLSWQRLVTGSPVDSVAVPEPTSAAIFVVFALAMCRRRRSRRLLNA